MVGGWCASGVRVVFGMLCHHLCDGTDFWYAV